GDRTYQALAVDMGNPHAVVFLDDLDEVGDLRTQPGFDAEDFPVGVNIEFVARRGDEHLAMRVYERGVGETQSCGTGACAAVVAAVTTDIEREHVTGPPGAALPSSYVVTVPGGRLEVTWTEDKHVHLKGAAVLVAEGVYTG
ncbi:MAG: diaminopimelate epimerase, partial [Nocardioidaceae bacterium]